MSRRLVLDDGRSQRELVVKERMTVGRDPGCDISDGDPRLSRRHAEFLATPSGLMVRDLESRNGIRVNGRMVQQATLAPGDLVEIAHLAVRFVDDSAIEPAGAALPTVPPVPVEGVQVRDGFEDDRTRVLPARSMSTQVSGAIPLELAAAGLAAADQRRFGPADPAGAHFSSARHAPVLRDAGDAAIPHADRTVPVSPRARPPQSRLSVLDLSSSRWGWRVLGQGVLLAGIVFLMTALPMLSWLWKTTGPVSGDLLVRMLSAPLLASLFAGLMVASLIARTTARGLERNDHS